VHLTIRIHLLSKHAGCDCNGHGTLQGGQCVCSSGYSGATCLYRIAANIVYWGSDLPNAAPTTTRCQDAQCCAALCDTYPNGGCKTYVWTRTREGQVKNECWLKSAVPTDIRSIPGEDSGIPEPAPASCPGALRAAVALPPQSCRRGRSHPRPTCPLPRTQQCRANMPPSTVRGMQAACQTYLPPTTRHCRTSPPHALQRHQPAPLARSARRLSSLASVSDTVNACTPVLLSCLTRAAHGRLLELAPRACCLSGQCVNRCAALVKPLAVSHALQHRFRHALPARAGQPLKSRAVSGIIAAYSWATLSQDSRAE
jgi:hypothetical protein